MNTTHDTPNTPNSSIAEIPFGASRLTGYLLRPAGPAQPRPTVILPAGYDSTAESSFVDTAWMALARGITRRGDGGGAGTIGNFWTDLVRATVHVLRPLSLVLALALVSQGVVQTLRGRASVTRLGWRSPPAALPAA